MSTHPIVAEVTFSNATAADNSIESSHLAADVHDLINGHVVQSRTVVNGEAHLNLANGNTVPIGDAGLALPDVVDLITNSFCGLLVNSAEHFAPSVDAGGVGPYGSQAWLAQGPTEFVSPQRVDVDLSKSYELSIYMRHDPLASGELPDHYVGLRCYDSEGDIIGSSQTIQRTPTTLAQPLNVGDTHLHLSSYDNIHKTGYNYHRSIKLLNYRNSNGFNYGDAAYSRWVVRDAWVSNSDMDTTNGIPLRVPWELANPYAADGVWPIGHPVANGGAGSRDKNVVMLKGNSSEDWLKYSGVVSGVDIGNDEASKHRPGTVQVSPVVHFNYAGASTDKLYFAFLSLKEV